MKPTLVRGLLSFVLALVVTASAGAAPDPSPTPPFSKEFAQADTNDDGKLSPDEAKKAGFFSARSFTSADADADGQVTLFELGKAVAKSATDSMSDHDKADTNKDGVVDKDEAATLGQRLEGVFTNADKNKDGMVDRGEMMNQVTDSYYNENATEPVVPNIINEKF